MEYNTLMLSVSDEDINAAAEFIKKGELIGFPTETVYGLGANALDPEAVADIYRAKGRPSDNPLIVHLSDFSEAENYVREIPDTAARLMAEFSPGPITAILPKKDIIPQITSGGLDTVGIRVPANETARKFIKACAVPIAAPSANLSGSPSPTSAKYVYEDMNGRIPAIIDGGECAVGVESTVVCFEGEKVKILRPGFVSGEDMINAGFEVLYARGITEKINDGEKILSPGMKYKHYAPKAEITILDGSLEDFIGYVSKNSDEKTYSMIFDGDAENFPNDRYVTYGDTPEEEARELFGVLRKLDDIHAEKVYARKPRENGVGLAVYNRLLRAAAFRVIKL